MNEIVKTFDCAYSQIGYKVFSREIWVSEDVYRNVNVNHYKGLPIYCSNLLPTNSVIIGKIFE